MNFHFAKKKKEKQKLGLAFFVVLFLIVLGFSGFYRWLSSGFHPLASGFWSLKGDGNSSLSFVFQDKKNLEKKVHDLETQLREKDIQIMRLAMFERENQMLKDSLGFVEKTTTASILVKPNYTLYDTLIIDAGVQDGIQEGDLVVGYGSVALGKIVDVRKNISFVELFSEAEIPSVLVHTNTSTYVDAVGKGGGMVTFTLPRDVSIAVGDILSLPVRNGILFGTVEKIEFESTDPVQTIFAESAVNINQLQYVEVMPGYEEQF